MTMPTSGHDEIILLSRDDLRCRGIRYSNVHLLELEAGGQFPRRVRLTTNRVAWERSEINEWVKIRLEARKTIPQAAPIDVARRRFRVT